MSDLILDSRVITLNSKDSVKLNASYNSNVIFSFSHILREEADINYTTCGLLSAQIPVSFYNVNVNNQLLSYTINGTAYTLTIPEGNYSANTFVTAFYTQFALGGHGKTLTITLNKLTGRFIFSTTTVYTLIFKYATSTIFTVLGFSTNDYTIGTNTTAPYPCNFLGVKKIKVISSALASFNYDSNSLGGTNLVQVITVNDSAFGLTTYQNQLECYGRLKTKRLDAIDIQLRDENDGLIDFDGVEWCLSFHLNIYRNNKNSDSVLDLKPLEILMKQLDEDVVNLVGNQGSPTTPPSQQIPSSEDNPSIPDLGQNVDNFQAGDNDLDVLLYNHVL